MNPNELNEIRERKKSQKCICKNCDECFFYRPWPANDMGGQPIGLKAACTLEVLAVTLRSLVGSVDGAQAASNEARNRVDAFGNAVVMSLEKLNKNKSPKRIN